MSWVTTMLVTSLRRLSSENQLLITSWRMGSKAGGRLIVEHHGRLQDDGAGQGDLVAGRRRGRGHLVDAGKQSDHPQDAPDPFLALSLGQAGMLNQGKATLSRRHRVEDAPCWKRKPNCCRTGPSSRSSSASTRMSRYQTSPLSGLSRPTMRLSKTLLPHPLGPMMTVMRPTGNSALIPRST